MLEIKWLKVFFLVSELRKIEYGYLKTIIMYNSIQKE